MFEAYTTGKWGHMYVFHGKWGHMYVFHGKWGHMYVFHGKWGHMYVFHGKWGHMYVFHGKWGHIYVFHEVMNGCKKSKDSLKACFENVNITFREPTWQNLKLKVILV